MVFPLRGADGLFRPFLTRVLPLRGEDGRILQWFGTNTDITELRQMEDALQEAARRKDEFLAMLAHELRNPLAPILNGLVILRMSEADREAVEKARSMIERQVLHMSRIVDDLLDVSRIQRGKVTLVAERLDLARLVRTVIEDQRTVCKKAGLTIEEALPEVPVWVEGDATRLTQVVANLVQNSIKFSERGGKIAARVEADLDKAQAVLAIRDTGVGIDPDMLPRLFVTFAQADSSLDRSRGGLGMGLALVKGLVELHGGEVQASSAGPGQGAEFIVRLPLQPEPAAIVDQPIAPRPPDEPLRILVVEDNRDTAESLRMLLELFGHEVTVAHSGPAGVQAARQSTPDVVLCDIGLPGMDGYGVVGELRRNPSTARTRVIALTGYGSAQDRLRSQEAGFDAHLVKPVQPQVLQDLFARTGHTSWGRPGT
jgi:signal transduction histidine kinase/CheY-like chemotaxis protein